MSCMEPSDAEAIANALNQLETLDANEYVVAFGPGGRQFCATPNGFTASFLPRRFLAKLLSGRIKKIVGASFGTSEYTWFFAYELQDGNLNIELGRAMPPALRAFVEQVSQSDRLLRTLRVQFGDGDAFVVWSQTAWACSNIPDSLQLKLHQLSSAVLKCNGGLKGSFSSGTIHNVQWHHDGSFYIKSDHRHMWNYKSTLLSSAWDKLWQGATGKQLTFKIQNELAYVAINPHAPDGDCYAMFKKQEPGQEVPLILHFGQGFVRTNLLSYEKPIHGENGQLVTEKAEEPHYQWAVSKRTGRPHAMEAWELKLKKGERVQILHDMGRDWFVAVGREKIKGWVHRSWLDFGHHKPHAKPKSAYARFQEDLQILMVPGKLCRFPSMKDYIDACASASCQPLKDDTSSLGICAHDLKLLLEGSGAYSYEWIKEGRNMWHPDRFARFCHADHVQGLKPLAEQMFVLYTILMETCKA